MTKFADALPEAVNPAKNTNKPNLRILSSNAPTSDLFGTAGDFSQVINIKSRIRPKFQAAGYRWRSTHATNSSQFLLLSPRQFLRGALGFFLAHVPGNRSAAGLVIPVEICVWTPS
jgi:hypothetical protein